jgi:hypothetical protein
MQLFQRMNCGKEGTGETYLYTKGRAYGHVEGIPDKLLFDVDVINVRRCGPLPESINDHGFRMTSREVMFYRDPKTGEALKKWTNPYTGQEVEVFHAANDPVNGNYTAKALLGGALPFSMHRSNAVTIMSYEANQFYENPLGGAYQKYVGGMYRATELINMYASAQDIAKLPKSADLPMHFSWARMSAWLPWMEMGGRLGYFYVHTAGQKYDAYEEMPSALRAEIDASYSEFRSAPSLDDQRPNVTSWTFFKGVVDSRAKK